MSAVTTTLLQVLLIDDDEGDAALTGDLVAQFRVPSGADMTWASTYEAGGRPYSWREMESVDSSQRDRTACSSPLEA